MLKKHRSLFQSTILYHTRQRTGKPPDVTHHWEKSVLGHEVTPDTPRDITRRTAKWGRWRGRVYTHKACAFFLCQEAAYIEWVSILATGTSTVLRVNYLLNE